jgi:hypothetical protein
MKLKDAFSRMRTGSMLVHQHDKCRKRTWYVIPGGPVTDEVADLIKNHPSVVGQKDGLFPGLDQTFRMRSFVGQS